MGEDKMNEKPNEEPSEDSEKIKTDKRKHERLNEERRKIVAERERFKDFVKDSMRKDARGITRKRKDKNLGGTRGRRGG
ncbi:MAG: hypothetical protein GY855_15755 [candidate division Zixibacteria bacterium]|nr:hypothetical protein [candidate division Zixibacteria bacterium]